jgi:glyoxylase-like metal-dependent hydrolase (beta-lactamase superfamily II)
VGGALIVVLGCEQPRRIPYIPPDLANWSDTQRGPKGLRLHVFTSTGSLAPPRAVFGGPSLERATIEVPAFLIEHPRAGLTLVGTGLAEALVEAPQAYLGWLLVSIVSPAVQDGQDIMSQLETAGLAADQVRRVILPDCRFPQTGAITRFPTAEVVVAEAERTWALHAGPAAAVQRADLEAVRRWEPVDFADAEPVGTFPRGRDLLGDGSVVLLAAPGYTPGTMAVLIRLASGPVVLAGGAAPLAGTMRTPVVPRVATDPDRWWISAWRLKRLRELAAGLVVAPGFEESGLEDAERRDVRVHRPQIDEAGAEGE